MKRLFNIIPWFVILLNLTCLYYIAKILITKGGPWGYGLIVLPFLFGTSLFIIPSIMKIKSKEDVASLNALNVIGFILILIIQNHLEMLLNKQPYPSPYSLDKYSVPTASHLVSYPAPNYTCTLWGNP